MKEETQPSQQKEAGKANQTACSIMKIETLNDLKQFLNGLNEVQLQQKAELHLTDVGIQPILSAGIDTEDHFLSDEGYCPVSTFEPLDDLDRLDHYVIRKAGFVYLFNEA